MEDIYKTLIRSFSEDISQEEKQVLAEWINASEENKKEYDTYQRMWQRATPNVPSKPFNAEQGWSELVPKLQEKKSYRPYLWMAASVFVLCIIFLFKSGVSEYNTPFGEMKTIVLSDGSIVKLSAGSTLIFSEDKARVAQLNGEAFFHVSKNGKAFIVQSEHAEIEVLGTKFNVNNRHQKTELSVTEGKVAFRSGNKKVILVENEYSEAKHGDSPTNPIKTDLNEKLLWQEKGFVFKNDSLNYIVSELERVFNAPTQLAPNAIGSLRVTGSYKNASLQTILSELSVVLNLTLEKTDTGYLLKGSR